ncbi:ATP synthase subunit delta [Acrasis kona]|uniref:ATP synthase subunit delta n=1 Tax=Acrasis kona TaxID=1008807 RepID=A0AAW2Z7E5_9EUKA
MLRRVFFKPSTFRAVFRPISTTTVRFQEKPKEATQKEDKFTKDDIKLSTNNYGEDIDGPADQIFREAYNQDSAGWALASLYSIRQALIEDPEELSALTEEFVAQLYPSVGGLFVYLVDNEQIGRLGAILKKFEENYLSSMDVIDAHVTIDSSFNPETHRDLARIYGGILNLGEDKKFLNVVTTTSPTMMGGGYEAEYKTFKIDKSVRSVFEGMLTGKEHTFN